MTYRELFALAQDKGYRLKMARDISDTGIISTEDYLWGDEAEVDGHYNADNIRENSYIEMCLIQKWLKDNYNCHIDPVTTVLENGDTVTEYRVLIIQKGNISGYFKRDFIETDLLIALRRALDLTEFDQP